jgi:hypothetical protein
MRQRIMLRGVLLVVVLLIILYFLFMRNFAVDRDRGDGIFMFTKSLMVAVWAAADQYYSQFNEYPELETLVDMKILPGKALEDPWGTPLQFEMKVFCTIRVAGPDKIFGTEDDMLLQREVGREVGEHESGLNTKH